MATLAITEYGYRSARIEVPKSSPNGSSNHPTRSSIDVYTLLFTVILFIVVIAFIELIRSIINLMTFSHEEVPGEIDPLTSTENLQKAVMSSLLFFIVCFLFLLIAIYIKW